MLARDKRSNFLVRFVGDEEKKVMSYFYEFVVAVEAEGEVDARRRTRREPRVSNAVSEIETL